MSKFLLGERVALYSTNGREIVTITAIRGNDGPVTTELKSGTLVVAHPKQIRKLKKRRVIWIHNGDVTMLTGPFSNPVEAFIEKPRGPYTKFIEVKAK